MLGRSNLQRILKKKPLIINKRLILKSLYIENFSSIHKADINLSRLTVLIGPQASGKSVVSKLIYFFNDIILEQSNFVLKEKSLEDYRLHIKNKFVEWFPETAWGGKQFKINYCLGDYSIKLVRSKYKNTLSSNIRISLSDELEQLYLDLKELRASIPKKITELDDDYEMFWRYEERSRSLIRKRLGNDFISNQLFIPAGRSFFTSVGKIVAAFEQGGLLDPITTIFGRRLANFRENLLRRGPSYQNQFIATHFNALLGGKIKFESNKEFVETLDGRVIPFNALSSGQQELLPLIISIASIANSRVGRRQIYIEEPEAHLFPTAQSSLITILASLVDKTLFNSLLITTHSPYVLAKINNLIKAGTLSRKSSINIEALSEIIPSSAWLPKNSVAAYAFVDSKLIPIVQKDGLIAADYLDDVSGCIANEFMSLLELEISKS
jgi:hypothetical protein